LNLLQKLLFKIKNTPTDEGESVYIEIFNFED